MKLKDLVGYLRDPEKLDELVRNEKIGSDSEELSIYMKDTLSLDSEISFFTSEETGDYLNFEKDGISYVQLFPVSLAIDALDFLDLPSKKYDDQATAKRLLDYAINDA